MTKYVENKRIGSGRSPRSALRFPQETTTTSPPEEPGERFLLTPPSALWTGRCRACEAEGAKPSLFRASAKYDSAPGERCASASPMFPYSPRRRPRSTYARCGEQPRSLRRGSRDSQSSERAAPHNETDDSRGVVLVVLPHTYFVLLLRTATHHRNRKSRLSVLVLLTPLRSPPQAEGDQYEQCTENHRDEDDDVYRHLS